MNQKLDQIITQLKELTLLEAAELVTAIEETFGVDTSVPVASGTPLSGLAIENTTPEAIEEKTSFDVYLEGVPADKKIAILKIVRNITGLGLKESKEIVDNLPRVVKEGITKEESNSIKKELEEAGAKVGVK